jgi:O-6-methylguanine DNA methyltransferase
MALAAARRGAALEKTWEDFPMTEQIAVGSLNTPIGVLWIACSEQGVCKLVFPRAGDKAALERWLTAHAPGHELTATSALLEQTCAELDTYFAGTRHDFTLPLDLRGSSFHQRVWLALTRIPYGRTISYGELARTLATAKAARAVGAACGANPVPIIAPCHRVLGSNGSLHGFGGGLPLKAWLLRHEGVLLDL